MSALKDLNKAIAQGSEKARARALWHTCDVLTAGSYSEDDIWTFGEVIDRLAEEIESSALAQRPLSPRSASSISRTAVTNRRHHAGHLTPACSGLAALAADARR